MAVNTEAEHTARLLGRIFALPASSPARARQTLREVVASGDDDLLDVVWASTSQLRGLVWSTPAYLTVWKGFGRAHGELALIYDRLVFLEIGWQQVRRRFVVPADEVVATWRTRGVTLQVGDTRYRISFVPPRHTNLDTVAGTGEGPGVSEIVDQLLPKSELVEALGLLSETVAMWRTYRIARVHCQLWQGVFAEVQQGKLPPWGSLQHILAASHIDTDEPEAEATQPDSVQRRKPGGRREQIATLLHQSPGLTVRQIADQLGTAPNNLYRPINQLIAAGQLRRDGTRLHPA